MAKKGKVDIMIRNVPVDKLQAVIKAINKELKLNDD